MLLARRPQRANRPRQQVVNETTIAAPVEGWDASTALANMRPSRAVQLKNWFPQPGWVEVRKGFRWHAWDLGASVKTVSSVDTSANTLTSNAHGYADGDLVKVYATTSLPGGLSASTNYYVVSAATNTIKLSLTEGGAAVDITSSGSGTIYVYKLSEPPVPTLAVWQGPSTSKMFAAAGNAMWDVTSRAAATLSYATGITSDRWQWTMHTTSGGHYLWMCNGVDAPVHYNGTTWAAPTISGITAADIVHTLVHKKRLWFVLKNSTKAAYLGTEAIQGSATTFELGSEFTRGGYLMASASWTRDGGSGADDYMVFISSEGQCVIYQGIDPASATTWEKVGTFDLARPIGRRCFTKYGADLLLLTVTGVFPLSKLLAVDSSSDDLVAVTNRVASAFNARAQSYRSNHGWEMCLYDVGTRLIVNIPTSEDATAIQYVMNTLTQAWCEFDAHNALTWTAYNGSLYFGGPDGSVFQADTGRADLDEPIRAIGQTAYSAFRSARQKRFSMLRPLITTTSATRPSLGISTDFVETSSLSQIPSGAPSGSVYDSGITYDSGATYGGAETQVNDWVNLAAIGSFGSVKFTATTGASVGGSVWGTMRWPWRWGSLGTSSEVMRIQGFLIHYETGGAL